MRILPENIKQRINNLERVFIIKIHGMDLWLSTKNILIMNGEEEIIHLSDRLSLEINEKDIPPISEINESAGIGEQKLKFSVNLLNYDGFGNNLENTEGSWISVYLFLFSQEMEFIQLNEAILIASGKIEEIKEEFHLITLICGEREYIRNKFIPEDIVTEENFPFAPSLSLGKPVPAVYGSFNYADLIFSDYNVIPLTYIDENTDECIISHHACKSEYIDVYYPIKNLFLAKVISGYEYYNTPAGAGVRFTEKIKCMAYIQPKQSGTQMNAIYFSSFKNAVDNKSNTYVTVNGVADFYLRFGEPGDFGFPDAYNIDYAYFDLCFSLGNVSGGSIAARVKYFLNGEFTYNAGYDITPGMSNTEPSFLFRFPIRDFYRILNGIELGITAEGNGSIEIKNMFICLKFFPY